MFENINPQENVFKDSAYRVSKALEHNLKNALLYKGDDPNKIPKTLKNYRTIPSSTFSVRSGGMTHHQITTSPYYFSKSWFH